MALGCKSHSHNRTTTAIFIQTQTTRNLTIDKKNAFNDLFLDSADVEKFLASENPGDTLSEAIRGFYNARNYEYAWFSSAGMIEPAFSFHSLYYTDNDKDQFNKSLERRLDKIEQDSTFNPNDSSVVRTELEVTLRFIEYALKHYKDKDVSIIKLATYIPVKKTTILASADSALADNSDNDLASISDAAKLLKEPLRKYTDIARKGGWQSIDTTVKKLSAGKNSPQVLQIKKRLQMSGELAGDDTTTLFTPELEAAVKAYQQSHGYKPIGIVTKGLVTDMNITALGRVQQILINMQRMRWMPTQTGEKMILVNIPEFEMYMDSGKTVLFQMDVVVGKQGHNTTMFSGNMSEIVFSPYWDVPPSIVKKEILPHIARDKDYLEKNDMEITGHEGGLPVVRQKPGEKNALGKVKFLFPNSFNIYLHDTPEKGLFSRSVRDLSHGCIRLSDAPKLAHYLLQNSDTWTPEKIDSAMDSGVQQFVRLKKVVPVVITYYTAWVDAAGMLHFADDIYSHDSKMAVKMFTDNQGE
jgi:murein L,D-transpeptidase YcbB/YkuD